MKFKKTLAAILAAALLACSMVAFVGCGQNDEEVIREALTEELEGIKTINEEFLAEMTAGMDVETFATYGIDVNEFMTAYLSGFDYSIDSITVDGESASAVVTLTCKSFSSYEEALNSNTQAAIESSDIAAMSEDEINEFVGTIMLDSLNGVEAVATDPITIEYTKVDNVWTPTAESEQAITTALLTN